jgi:hypothetical protein
LLLASNNTSDDGKRQYKAMFDLKQLLIREHQGSEMFDLNRFFAFLSLSLSQLSFRLLLPDTPNSFELVTLGTFQNKQTSKQKQKQKRRFESFSSTFLSISQSRAFAVNR